MDHALLLSEATGCTNIRYGHNASLRYLVLIHLGCIFRFLEAISVNRFSVRCGGAWRDTGHRGAQMKKSNMIFNCAIQSGTNGVNCTTYLRGTFCIMHQSTIVAMYFMRFMCMVINCACYYKNPGLHKCIFISSHN